MPGTFGDGITFVNARLNCYENHDQRFGQQNWLSFNKYKYTLGFGGGKFDEFKLCGSKNPLLRPEPIDLAINGRSINGKSTKKIVIV